MVRFECFKPFKEMEFGFSCLRFIWFCWNLSDILKIWLFLLKIKVFGPEIYVFFWNLSGFGFNLIAFAKKFGCFYLESCCFRLKFGCFYMKFGFFWIFTINVISFQEASFYPVNENNEVIFWMRNLDEQPWSVFFLPSFFPSFFSKLRKIVNFKLENDLFSGLKCFFTPSAF